jgi:hypothetical protein
VTRPAAWKSVPLRRRSPPAPAATQPSASSETPIGDAYAGPTCIFCDRPTGPVEYLWPEWLCHFFTDRLGEWNKENGPDEAVVDRMRKEVDQTIDCICGPCSHGWMRRLDDNVSTFLTSMMVGNKTRLTPIQQRSLARWSAKNAAVIECCYDAPTRTPPSAFEYLRRIGVHPGTQVLVGRYDGEAQVLSHERDLFCCTIDGEEHYLSQSSFVIGKVLIQVLADPQQQTTPELGADVARLLLALVPSLDRKIDWPPPLSIDDPLYGLVRLGPM